MNPATVILLSAPAAQGSGGRQAATGTPPGGPRGDESRSDHAWSDEGRSDEGRSDEDRSDEGRGGGDGDGGFGRAGEWAGLAGRLGEYGLNVLVPQAPDAAGMRYVAGISLAISAADPSPPLLLVARGAAGPLLPAVALAQRAAHRAVGGYLFLDAGLPSQGPRNDHDHQQAAPLPVDWPDAPCGYLHLSAEHDQDARVAALRGWPVRRPTGDTDLAESLAALIRDL
jgi:hypothetical protein